VKQVGRFFGGQMSGKTKKKLRKMDIFSFYTKPDFEKIDFVLWCSFKKITFR